MNKVFISYVSENIEIVKRLYGELKAHGIQVWLDRNDIPPGVRWKQEIRQAIQQGAFFIACFSQEYSIRDSTYMNEELMIAIEQLRQRRTDQAWFIPVKLNECEIPDRDIGGSETLQDLQYVNLYADWEVNIQRIREIVQPASSETINANTVEQSANSNAVEEFVKGLTYQNRRNYEKAIERYTEALRLNPLLAEAYNNRGNVYNSIGEHDCAIVDYTEAIELKPDLADAYYNRGNACHNKREYDRAIVDYNRAIELKPNYAEAYYNRGVTYSEKSDFDSAIVDYNRAIELKPNYAEAYYSHGVAYHNKGDFDSAIVDYNEAIALNPNYAEAYNNRGVAYINRGDVDHAIADYNEAIALNSNYADAYYNRGVAWLRQREWEKARGDLTIARNMGTDIIVLFRDTSTSVASFERRNGVQLPADIAAMLTP